MDKNFEKYVERLENLALDLDLGAEGQPGDSFEKLKANMKERFEDFAEEIKDLVDDDKAEVLRQKIEEVQVQLALGKAEARDAFEAQQRDLRAKVAKLEGDLKALSSESKEEIEEEYQEISSELNTRLDVLRLRFALGKSELEDEIDELRQKAERSVKDLQARLNREDLKSKAGEFAGDMSKAMDQVKAGFKKLFD